MRGCETRADRAVLAFSLIAAGYFGLLALGNNVLRLDWIWLGALWELLTIPMIAAVAGVFAFAVVRLLRNRSSANACNVGAALILLVLNGLVWGL